ncbi:hypothetical protein CDV50_03380 [Haematobacter massiliensis]|uniref:Uncharacterized protein n=1 Tax=Haematobacter massiliensis TaxID=195105 RepID=A0A086XYT0_9RHOB|nr:hypothetical protein [Haematobacter massiliensis]KFI27180.1 hypothetical protein CN97_01950 [Haematobacter massiliensis]OWJ73224.1 hypothetical protein CDV50_03380 [Haematobacter massiliensis]OWJ85398.1 hypothetical protein CDV51_12095 [Haematobacter massiliensis]QBJ23679.1 hypothetical protein HmaOT1_05050 [Haematobacter massiliensis]
MLSFRYWAGGGAAVALLLAGMWTGDRLATAAALRANAAAAEQAALRAAALRQAEMERLRAEAGLDLALGKVMDDARDMDDRAVVFDAGRMRQLFPAR